MLDKKETPFVTPTTEPKKAQNYDPDGEMNENFIRDPQQMESDANYFGCNAENWS